MFKRSNVRTLEHSNPVFHACELATARVKLIVDEKMSKPDTKIKILALVIALLTVSVFLPALQYDFVNFDDNLVVYDNPNIRALDSKFLKYMLSFEHTMWTPLTRLSRAVDYAVWELDPTGHHLTNILLHGFNTFLAVILIIRLIGARAITPSSVSGKEDTFLRDALIAGGVTGLLFGIHPLRVESVVWVTERKDVLSGSFMLLTLIYYLKSSTVSVQKKIRFYYVLSLIFFAMALMSKPIAVVIPLLLVILDFYPLERLKFGSGLRSQVKVIAGKVPFIALSLLFSVLTILSYVHEGNIVTKQQVGLADRMLVSIKALCFYLYKMIWPMDLAPLYPYPKEISITSPEFAIPLIIVTAITLFCVFSWKRQKLWLAVWAYFIAALFPVLGIMKFGIFDTADRYTYLPSLGPFLLVGLLAALIYKKLIADRPPSTVLKAFFFVPLLTLFCVLSVLSIRQAKIWENSFTLWAAQIEHFPENYFGYINLGVAYATEDKYEQALKYLDRAVELNPSDKKTFMNRGKVMESLGRYQEAIDDYKEAARYYPEFEVAYYNLGFIYDSRYNNYPEALKYYNRAIELDPDYSNAYNNRGIVYAIMGDYNMAVMDFTSAIDINSEDAAAYENRGHAYKRLGDNVRAEKDFQVAERLKQQEKK